jgi:hypothetical protein
MKRMPKFGPRYGFKMFGEGGATDKKAPPPKKPTPPPSDSDDLVPRGNLPSTPTIKPGAGFGDDIPRKKTKKLAKGGSLPDLTGDGKITRADVLKGRGVFKKGGAVKSSASRRADGIAQRGKTKGRIC